MVGIDDGVAGAPIPSEGDERKSPMTPRFLHDHTGPWGKKTIRILDSGCQLVGIRAAKLSFVGLLIAGGLLLGCKGEPRPSSDQAPKPAPEERATPAGLTPDETAKRVTTPGPESMATPSTETAPPEPPQQAASPRHADEADPVEAASPVARQSPAVPDAAADEPVIEPDGKADEAPTLDEVLERHGDELRSVRGVVAVAGAECNGAPCIRVTVTRRTQKLLSQLPQTLEGYPVSVVEHQGGH
jgi:hypothetical protein